MKRQQGLAKTFELIGVDLARGFKKRSGWQHERSE